VGDRLRLGWRARLRGRYMGTIVSFSFAEVSTGTGSAASLERVCD
jgi:hypothetical protein